MSAPVRAAPPAALSAEQLVAAVPLKTFGKGESVPHFLARQTHVNLQERGLTSLTGISALPHLKVGERERGGGGEE
jgi:hypothetical protein